MRALVRTSLTSYTHAHTREVARGKRGRRRASLRTSTNPSHARPSLRIVRARASSSSSSCSPPPPPSALLFSLFHHALEHPHHRLKCSPAPPNAHSEARFGRVDDHAVWRSTGAPRRRSATSSSSVARGARRPCRSDGPTRARPRCSIPRLFRRMLPGPCSSSRFRPALTAARNKSVDRYSRRVSVRFSLLLLVVAPARRGGGAISALRTVGFTLNTLP